MKTLHFTTLINYKLFEVTYESEAPYLNKVTNITVDGLPIDVDKLKSHEVYDSIRAAMVNNADSYWEEETPVAKVLNEFKKLFNIESIVTKNGARKAPIN